MLIIDEKEYYGWANQEKVDFMKSWALDNKVALFVEIGVYGGASFVPVADRMNQPDYPVKNAECWAIDPWDIGIATKDGDPIHKEWWAKNVDLQKAKESFADHVKNNPKVHILEETSDEAKKSFVDDEIGMLHIDGGHGFQAIIDAYNWLPTVSSGGLIVMDDTNWTYKNYPTVRMAIDYLIDNGCKYLKEIQNCTFLVKE